MTGLRKRMIECLQLRGMSERTQEAYVRAVRQLADHSHISLDLISEEELRQYFLHIMNVKKYSRNITTIALCGISSSSSTRSPRVDHAELRSSAARQKAANNPQCRGGARRSCRWSACRDIESA